MEIHKLAYDKVVEEIIKFLSQSNVKFIYTGESSSGEDKFEILVNNRKKKDFCIYYTSSYNILNLVYNHDSFEDPKEYRIDNFDIRDKLLKAKELYENKKKDLEERLNFKILKHLKGK